MSSIGKYILSDFPDICNGKDVNIVMILKLTEELISYKIMLLLNKILFIYASSFIIKIFLSQFLPACQCKRTKHTDEDVILQNLQNFQQFPQRFAETLKTGMTVTRRREQIKSWEHWRGK